MRQQREMARADAGSLRQRTARMEVETGPRRFHDVSAAVDGWLGEIDAGEGLLTVFLRHTSASLTIQENADPDVLRDLLDVLDRLAPASGSYRHGSEGPDDMPAHIKTMLTGASIAVPVLNGRMDLGTWQGLYVIEHRARGHARSLTLHYLGT
ncbi:secondary thiamine-phosphate synthase enzyme YjbQ [Amorphus sp. 3PC139-8]|uniref:secondary thiamine-phosphate synthase enzyme YjbQ n=1 Tax=Amorphus sp. 3PC139-8 TaxID=2735676 RepID=UPI00345D8395